MSSTVVWELIVRAKGCETWKHVWNFTTRAKAARAMYNFCVWSIAHHVEVDCMIGVRTAPEFARII